MIANKALYLHNEVHSRSENRTRVEWVCPTQATIVPAVLYSCSLCLYNTHLKYNTVNREYFVSKIFHAMNFHVKSFSDKRPCTALSLILRMYFVRLIFAQAMLSENILTSKYSRFTVCDSAWQP